MILLTRPICFIDIESTGLDRQHDRIIELSILKMNVDNSFEVKTRRFNPNMPIPASSSAIHGILDEHVALEPTFDKCAKSLFEYISDCDIAGFNSNAFDVPMLFNEFQRAGIYLPYEKINLIDVGNIFKIKEQRTLEAASKFYLDKPIEKAHSAEADVKATYEVFMAQLSKYEDLPKTISELAKFSNYDREIVDISGCFSKDAEGHIILNFGKYKGEKAMQHIDFVEWMLYKGTFAADTLNVCQKLVDIFYQNDKKKR